MGRFPKVIYLCILIGFYTTFRLTVAYADTSISSNITVDTVWAKTNSPYIVSGTIQVYPNITLTIEPGVVIKFNLGGGLKIGGELIAKGLKDDLIIFTANTPTPTASYWDRIEFAIGSIGTLFDSNDNYLSGSIIDNCIIEYSKGIETVSTFSNVFINESTFISSGLNLSLSFTNTYYAYTAINIQGNYFNNSPITASMDAPNGPGRINISNNYLINSSLSAHLSSAGNLRVLNNQVTGGDIQARLSAIPWNAGDLKVQDNQIVGGNIQVSCYGASYVSGNVVKMGDLVLQGDGQIYDNYILGGSVRSTDSRTLVDIYQNFITGGELNVLSVQSTINIRENVITQGGGIKYAYYLGHNGISINRNDIYDNLPYDLYNDSPADIDASNNWWGTNDLNTISKNIFDYYDDFTKGKVIFEPIATSPVAQTSLSNLITKYYATVLDRAPDQSGDAFWRTEILRILILGIDIKEGFQALAKFFFNCAEYGLKNKSNVEFVRDLYQTFLGREPDQGGWDFWVSYLNDGLTRNMLITQFAYSVEFKNYVEGLLGIVPTRPEDNLVNDLYRGFLNRFPDTGGFDTWVSLMRSAQCTGAQAVRDVTYQIALAFMNSAEYGLRGRDNWGYVEDLYNAILMRGADPGGYLHWVGLLNDGVYTREQVLQFFTDSAEFQFRVDAVINAGCIN